MLMQEEKGSKAGEPKPQSCPPHLISEISAPGAVAKPAANHGSLQPGTERRCRSRCGSAVLLTSARLPARAVGTCGSRAVEQQIEQNFPLKFAFVNESLPTAPAAFTSLRECVFKVLTVLESITGLQNGQGWKGSLLLQNPAKADSPIAICTGSHLQGFWISPEKETPQPLWVAHSSALSSSKDRSFSSFSGGTSCFSVCACHPLSCC